jgi:hypothetical protein
MLTPSELDAPALLSHAPPGSPESLAALDWSTARSFPSLREALHVAMAEDAPAGQEPCIRLSDGRILEPTTLHALFDSLQGP